MSMNPGTRFGPYEVAALIGVGGMGEVYRATDTNLKRDVALKVLPETFVGNADRLARFQREAEVLATLNDHNVAQIYGLERSGDTTALVMELVDGPTLAERIAQGPLPVSEALNVAQQIASALEAAHERGIVHRDLKPANIKLKADGTVKVLDFGIAKALDPRAVSGPRTPALTTPAMTEAGVMLGTAAYMAPEQARGKAVDKRADIWAFGCVLYEMLTGKPAFLAEDITTTLARVLERDPDLRPLPAGLSPAVSRTLELCLQKDLKRRIADIRDVKLALDGAFESAPQIAVTARMVRPVLRRALPGLAGLVIGGVLVAFAISYTTPPVAQHVSRLTYRIPPEQPFPTIGRSVLALSPDGSQIVYSTVDGIYVRPLDSFDARLIPGTQGGVAPFLSPDGKRVGYFGSHGKLEQVALSGGASVAMADLSSLPFGASWAADGTILYGQGSAGVFRVTPGRKPELVIPATGRELIYGPELLPDGDNVLFSVTSTGSWDESQIAAQSLSSGRRTVIVENGGDAHYLPSGYLTYVVHGVLSVVRFDAKTLKASSDPFAVGVSLFGAGISPASNYAVARNGTLAYLSAASTGGVPVWIDRDGHEEPLEGCPCMQGSISPDATRVAFTAAGAADPSAAGIIVFSLAERATRRLTLEPGLWYAPVWTPDGERIAYGSPQGIFWRRADGTGSAERLLTGSGLTPSAWTPDGRLIFEQGVTGAGGGDIGVLSVSGERKREWLLATEFEEGRAALSPDGHWLAYQSDESGRHEVYVRPFPNVEGGKWAISTGGGEDPRWSRDGRALFFIGGQTLMSADVATMPTFSSRPPQKVIDLNGYSRFGVPFPFDVSPDGQRFLINKGFVRGSLEIVVVQNWVEELKQRTTAQR
jgi:serine/threonine-protein kinase